jgi:protein-histidine N-methyltransferase
VDVVLAPAPAGTCARARAWVQHGTQSAVLQLTSAFAHTLALATHAAHVQEEDTKLLQDPDLPVRQRLAVEQRLSEKQILQATTDAIRARLAPIRGIPTKGGKLEDPNEDLLDIFDTIESGPRKLWGSFARWASGKDDPEFGNKKKKR